MSKWTDFYKTRLNEEYRLRFGKKYSLFLDLLKEQLSNGVRFAEEHGCGIGTVTRLISPASSKTNHFLLDNDPDMIDLALSHWRASKCVFFQKDIREPLLNYKADLIHSHGVLEHFSDPDIKKIIKNQKDRAKTIVHYVPSHKYKEPSFGDERLLAPGDWYKICRPDSIIEFNHGFDLILSWGLR